MPYEKHFVWIAPADLDRILALLRAQSQLATIPIAEARQCEALQPGKSLVHVPPSVWSANCVRQGSWFRASPLADCHLFVGNAPFSWEDPSLAPVLSGSIRIMRVTPPPEPTPTEYLPLLEQPAFTSTVQEEWWHLLDREKPVFERFFQSKKVLLSLEDILKIHSANHAHFLAPSDRFIRWVEMEGSRIPISLFRADLICSACMELFGIIGRQFGRMLIKNCPGLKYVRLGAEEYFDVHIHDPLNSVTTRTIC